MGGKGSGKGSGGKRKGAGRPKGSKHVLPRGAVAAILAARRSHAEDPNAAEAEGFILQIMRGTIRTNTVTRLGAARDVLDRRIGKPTQVVEHQGDVTIKVVTGVPQVEPEGSDGDAAAETDRG